MRAGDGPPVRNDEDDCDVGYKAHVVVPVGELEGSEDETKAGSFVLGPTSSWTADGEDSDIAVTRECGNLVVVGS